MSHTPGPWHIGSEREDTGETFYNYDTLGWPFFVGMNETRIGKTDHHVAIGIQSSEDARLIAAAPELLAACEQVVEWYDLINQWYPDMGGLIRGMETAKMAISKAKGEML